MNNYTLTNIIVKIKSGAKRKAQGYNGEYRGICVGEGLALPFFAPTENVGRGPVPRRCQAGKGDILSGYCFFYFSDQGGRKANRLVLRLPCCKQKK